jgi:hypothetical protein
MFSSSCPIGGTSGDLNMAEETCAACDCKLEGHVIKVKVGGKSVEVCCEECATALKEAHASTAEEKQS